MQKPLWRRKTFWLAILWAIAGAAKVYDIDIPETLINSIIGILSLVIPGLVAYDTAQTRKKQKAAVTAGWMVSDAGPVAAPGAIPPPQVMPLVPIDQSTDVPMPDYYLDSEQPRESDSWMIDSHTDWQTFENRVAFIMTNQLGIEEPDPEKHPVPYYIAFMDVGATTPCEAWADAFEYSDRCVEATDAAFKYLFGFSLEEFKEDPKKYLARSDKGLGCYWPSLESMARNMKRLSMLRATKEAHREAAQLEAASNLKPRPDVSKYRSLAGCLEYIKNKLPAKPVEPFYIRPDL